MSQTGAFLLRQYGVSLSPPLPSTPHPTLVEPELPVTMGEFEHGGPSGGIDAHKSAGPSQLNPTITSTSTKTPVYAQDSRGTVVLVRRRKHKDKSPWGHLSRWFVENQIGMLRIFSLATRLSVVCRLHQSRRKAAWFVDDREVG